MRPACTARALIANRRDTARVQPIDEGRQFGCGAWLSRLQQCAEGNGLGSNQALILTFRQHVGAEFVVREVGKLRQTVDGGIVVRSVSIELFDLVQSILCRESWRNIGFLINNVMRRVTHLLLTSKIRNRR